MLTVEDEKNDFLYHLVVLIVLPPAGLIVLCILFDAVSMFAVLFCVAVYLLWKEGRKRLDERSRRDAIQRKAVDTYYKALHIFKWYY